MSDEAFQRYSAYYDLLYRDKDYVAETRYIAKLLRESSPGTQSVLEFGSGTGRHGRLLAGEGFQVFGVERSATMVAAASAGGNRADDCSCGRFDCVEGDINAIRLDRSFDAVISLFHVVSYQTHNAEVRRTFENAARHLHPGGVFIFDVWHGPAVLCDRPAVRVKRVENDQIRLTRIAEPELSVENNVVVVQYTILAESKADGSFTTFGETHRMRYFFKTEIEVLANLSGLTLEKSEEFLSGNEPSEKTWGVTYVLRKLGSP